MARNHTNYSFGNYCLEPMSGGKKCMTFTGKLCEVKEKLSYKKNGTYHWLSLGFDADSWGPTKRLFFDVSKDKEIIWLFQMAKKDFILQEGDEVTIKYSGKAITMIVNGEAVDKVTSSKTSAMYKELYRCRIIDSIDDVLRKVCSWALPADVRDEVEGESVYRCKEMLCDIIFDAQEQDLRVLIGKLFFPEADHMNFKEIHRDLRKIMGKKTLTEILSGQEELIKSEESDPKGEAHSTEYEGGADVDNGKDSQEEFTDIC